MKTIEGLKTLAELEKEIIVERYNLLKKNKLRTSISLGITLKTLNNRLDTYRIIHERIVNFAKEKAMIPIKKGLTKRKIKELEEYTGYEQPTPEERDEWYNMDRF